VYHVLCTAETVHLEVLLEFTALLRMRLCIGHSKDKLCAQLHYTEFTVLGNCPTCTRQRQLTVDNVKASACFQTKAGHTNIRRKQSAVNRSTASAQKELKRRHDLGSN